MKYQKKYSSKNQNDNSELTIIFNGNYYNIDKWNYNLDYYSEDEYLPGVHVNIHQKYSENEKK